MQKIKIDNFLILGIKIRTNNKNEQNPNTSKIAKHWKEFYSKNIPSQITDCESDVDGDFDVLAEVEVSKKNNNFENAYIVQGKYLVFKKKWQNAKCKS